MKKYISYILMGVAVICTGCDDYFSNSSPSTMDAAVFASAEQTEQTVAGLYVILGEQNSYRSRLAGPWVVPGTDCEMYVAGAPDFAIYTMTAVGNSDFGTAGKTPWSYLTNGIERANVVVDGIEQYSDISDAKMSYLYGEALTMRAWMTYEMVKLWGDIPYMFKPMDGTDATLYPAKADRNKIFEKLREDLKRAAEVMPKSEECPEGATNTVERMNREFALGLLARIDLMYAGKAMRPDEMKPGSAYRVQYNTTPEKRAELLSEVMWACEEVINDDGYGKLLDNYEDVFKAVSGSVTDYDKSESLWEIPFADGVRGQFMNRMGAYANSNAKGYLKHYTRSAKSNAKIVATPSYVLSFEPGDKRKWVAVSPGEWNYDDKSKIEGTSGKVLYQKPEKINKMYFGKYRHEWMAQDMTIDDDGINVPQMRFADILLMYAEAYIGEQFYEVAASKKGSLDGQELFNKVRARAGLAPKPLNKENLMQERAWEFGGEFIRKYDLMRWGEFATKLWDAQEDIAHFTHLNAEEGKIDFTGTPYEDKLPTSIYVKYVEDPSVAQSGTAYRIDKIYGLQLGENDVPEGYVDASETGGWVKIDAFLSDGAPATKIDATGNRIFGLELSKDVLESHQYWPIFNDVLSANHNLWNDYGY